MRSCCGRWSGVCRQEPGGKRARCTGWQRAEARCKVVLRRRAGVVPTGLGYPRALMMYRAVVCQGEDARLCCGAEQALRRQASGLPRALLVCSMVRRCRQTDNTQDRADAHVMYRAAVCLLRRRSWFCAPGPRDYPERSSFDQWSGMVSGQRIRRQVPPERSLCGNDWSGVALDRYTRNQADNS